MLEGLRPKDRRRQCKTGDFANSLDDSDRKILEDALADDQLWSLNALVVALRERGVSLTRETIDKHRRKVCQCWKI